MAKWSEKKGKNLGGPYKTREEAAKRLRQVEFFKHNKGWLRTRSSRSAQNERSAANDKVHSCFDAVPRASESLRIHRP